MQFFVTFSVVSIFIGTVLSVDYLPVILEYTKTVRGYVSLTLLSCPGRFNPEIWISATKNTFLLQFVNIELPLNVEKLAQETNCHQLHILDMGCSGHQSAIISLSHYGQFNNLCRAFLFLDSRNNDSWFTEEFKPLLEEIEFTYLSNVVYWTPFPIENLRKVRGAMEIDQINLYDVWNPGRRQGGLLKMDLVGIYQKLPGTESFEFTVVDDTVAAHRRLDLSELHLNCAIVVTSPFNDTLENYLTHNYHPYLDTVHRLNFRTLSLVQDYFNFTLKVKRTQSWGYILNESPMTFDGMVGMVQRSEVDFGCSPAWFKLERHQVVDYGAQTWAIRPLFLFRHPNTRGLGKNLFLSPFDGNVWPVLLLCSIVIMILVANTVQQEWGLRENVSPVQRDRLRRDDRISSCIKYTKNGILSFYQSARVYIGIFLQQGIHSTDEGHLISTKLTVFLLFVYSFLLYQFYSASIVGSLLMEQPKIIRTVKDLTNSHLQLGIQDIVYNYDFFKHTTDENALELYAKKIKILDKKTGNYSLNFYSVAEGLRKLQYEAFAFHVDLDYVFQRIIDTFDEKDICDLTMISLYPQQPMGNVFPKGSALRYIINYGIHRTIETGLFSREKNSWIAKNPVCQRKIQSEDLQVELFPLISLFWFLLCGVALSVLILVAEIIVHKLTLQQCAKLSCLCPPK